MIRTFINEWCNDDNKEDLDLSHAAVAAPSNPQAAMIWPLDLAHTEKINRFIYTEATQTVKSLHWICVNCVWELCQWLARRSIHSPQSNHCGHSFWLSLSPLRMDCFLGQRPKPPSHNDLHVNGSTTAAAVYETERQSQMIVTSIKIRMWEREWRNLVPQWLSCQLIMMERREWKVLLSASLNPSIPLINQSMNQSNGQSILRESERESERLSPLSPSIRLSMNNSASNPFILSVSVCGSLLRFSQLTSLRCLVRQQQHHHQQSMSGSVWVWAI